MKPNLKKGAVVRNKQTGQIGKIVHVMKVWSMMNSIGLNETHNLIKVRFFDLPKKYTGYYKEDNFEPYKYPECVGNTAVSNWLTRPSERFRNSLKVKMAKEQHRLATQTGKIRMDGR